MLLYLFFYFGLNCTLVDNLLYYNIRNNTDLKIKWRKNYFFLQFMNKYQHDTIEGFVHCLKSVYTFHTCIPPSTIKPRVHTIPFHATLRLLHSMRFLSPNTQKGNETFTGELWKGQQLLPKSISVPVYCNCVLFVYFFSIRGGRILARFNNKCNFCVNLLINNKNN